MDAWNRNVLLVSPSTLLFVVRTVAHLWRQEAQSRNAQEIAKRGAELYDKFVGFVEDMNSLGNRLKQAQSAFDDANNKLSNGRGNLVGQDGPTLLTTVSQIDPVRVSFPMSEVDYLRAASLLKGLDARDLAWANVVGKMKVKVIEVKTRSKPKTLW